MATAITDYEDEGVGDGEDEAVVVGDEDSDEGDDVVAVDESGKLLSLLVLIFKGVMKTMREKRPFKEKLLEEQAQLKLPKKTT